MENKGILLIFLFVFFIGSVLSAPPVTLTQQFETGYIIIDSPQITLKQNANFTVNFFLYNKSNGYPISNSSGITCYYYLANSSGTVLLYSKPSFDNIDKYWYYKILGGNFSELGNYNYGINCYDGTLGGAIVGSYEVTKSGKTLTIEKSIIIMALFFGLIAFGIFNFLLGSKISENYFIGVIFIGLGVVVSLILLNFVVTASKELISEEFFNVGDKLLTASLIITSFLILIFGIFFLFNAINELRIKKEKKKYGENYNPQTKQYEY